MVGVVAYIAILGGVALWSLKRPAIGITAIICMFSLEQWGQVSSSFFITFRTITNIAIGIIVLLAVANTVLSNVRTYKLFPTISWLVFTLFIYAYVTTIWSLSQDIVYSNWKHFFPYLVTIIFLGPLLINSKTDIHAIAKSLLIFGLPLVFLLLFFVEWEHRRILVAGNNYETALYGNPLEIGTFASIIFIVVVFHNISRLKKIDLLLRVAAGLLCLALIVESGSRGQLLAVLLSVCIFWPLRNKITDVGTFVTSGIFIFAILILTWLAISNVGGGNIRWTYDYIEADLFGRMATSIKILSIWLDSGALLIPGLGNYSSFSLIGTYPHNVPVEVLCEEGIIGAIIYLAIVHYSIRSVINSLRIAKAGTQQHSCIILMASLLLFSFIISLKQGNLLGNLYFFMFAILVGRYEYSLKYENFMKAKYDK